MRIDNPVAQEGNITGSFTGSFDGIGSGSFSGSYEGSVRSIDLVATGSFSGSLRSDDALLTGSYTGSFKGDGTDVLNVVSASYAVTSSHAVSALSSSHALNADDAISSSYALSSSYVTIGNISTNLADNRVLTSTATDKYNAEANLTFDGSTLTVTGDAIVTGDFTVTGTTTELQVSSLNVEDLNITVASGSATAAAANGAGLTVDGANATILYGSSGDDWTFNKNVQAEAGLKVTNVFEAFTNGNIFGSGTLSISSVNTGHGDNELYAMDQAVQTSDDVQFDSFGVGTAASGTTGEIRATGDITAYYSSDERLKENFKTLDGALDKVNQLNGYEFDWKDGIEDVVSKKGHDIGVKAQEVQALYPELVHERDNGYLAVDYVKLTAVLLHAVKELSAKVDELSK